MENSNRARTETILHIVLKIPFDGACFSNADSNKYGGNWVENELERNRCLRSEISTHDKRITTWPLAHASQKRSMINQILHYELDRKTLIVLLCPCTCFDTSVIRPNVRL